MGRRVAGRTSGPPPTEAWPDWIFAPPSGHAPDAAAEEFCRFRQWQDDKRRWLADHGLERMPLNAWQERQRRACHSADRKVGHRTT